MPKDEGFEIKVHKDVKIKFNLHVIFIHYPSWIKKENFQC